MRNFKERTVLVDRSFLTQFLRSIYRAIMIKVNYNYVHTRIYINGICIC